MKVVIWNQHWHTLGGGEVYAGQLARLLCELDIEVLILGSGADPRRDIQSRLGIDLSKAGYISIVGEDQIERHLHDDDFFVNGSFGSELYSPVKKSLYICHFPSKNPRNFISDFFERKASISCWDADWKRFFPIGSNFPVLGDAFISINSDVEITINVISGSASIQIDDKQSKLFSAGETIVLKEIRSLNVFSKGNSPSILKIGIDKKPRLLSSYISHYVNPQRNYLKTYSKVWANSRFTQRHIFSILDSQSEIVYPPVSMANEASNEFRRDPFLIVSVGRFMSPSQGHCKNQHLLIEAFKELCELSQSPWKLVLIGGVDERGMKYFKEIEKKVSENQLKIELAPNITNFNKESILKRATYYWHAGGMGVSHNRPQDMEHFGISVIESIHAGLIPLVFNAAGPAEILNDFPELRFDNLTQLAEVTHELSCSDLTQITDSIAGLPLNFDLLTFQKKVFSLLDEIK